MLALPLPGNHDYYSGELSEWVTALKTLGVHVLMNERVLLPEGGGVTEGIILAGLEDFDTKRFEYVIRSQTYCDANVTHATHRQSSHSLSSYILHTLHHVC